MPQGVKYRNEQFSTSKMAMKVKKVKSMMALYPVCDQILENGSKSHICILLLYILHYYMDSTRYFYNVEFFAEILWNINEILIKHIYVYRNIFKYTTELQV